MEQNRGIGPGFDLMRLVLSLEVVLFHSVQLSYGRAATTRLTGGLPDIFVTAIVPAFFALSGFLVTGSMLRLGSVKTFLLFRGLRIVPALAAETILSALLLGPLTTAVAFREYFTDRHFFIYMTNMVGVIRYQLPGVFLDNPVPGVVNGQLWTLPSELHCYVIATIAMLLGLAARRKVTTLLFLVLAIGECATTLRPHAVGTPLISSPEMLLLSFICGGVFYLWRERIPANAWLFAASLAGFAVTSLYAEPLCFLLGTVSITYVICYLGMLRFDRLSRFTKGDYSYGIYLYSFPIQQFVAWALPGWRVWYVNLAIGLPLTLAFAIVSWHLLEKRALSLRRRFLATSGERAVRVPQAAVPRH